MTATRTRIVRAREIELRRQIAEQARAQNARAVLFTMLALAVIAAILLFA